MKDRSLVLTNLHHGADVLARKHDGRLDERFLDFLDHDGFGHFRRVIDLNDFPVSKLDFIDNARRGGDQVNPELATDPLADDIHMKQTQKADSETETEGVGIFRLINERGVV